MSGSSTLIVAISTSVTWWKIMCSRSRLLPLFIINFEHARFIDIVNCIPTIMQQVFKLHEIDPASYSTLTQYVGTLFWGLYLPQTCWA
mmetsp:Transcript_6765/g.14130  ORF Transcript_6765/g.14130 Transcript_6765/m.14130 type:complete len:88 (+) Transcript_6765:242-505(+)